MKSSELDVVGVGNAIVDVLAPAEDAFLAAHGVPKGGMILIDEATADRIYGAMAQAVEISGGSAANSIACIASLSGRGGFIGKVADDTLGQIFRHDLRALGVQFDTRPLQDGPATGRCLINVTPDAQRSMTTFLGAAGLVSPDDIDAAMIESAAITFFEGYLFEQPVARSAFIKACEIAKAAGRRTALTLSDASCVERQRAVLHDFTPKHIDILLANDREAEALFGSHETDAIIDKARAIAPLVAVTHGARGSVLIPRNGEPVTAAAIAPERLVDTTGAGDAYAAGLLFGLARGLPLDRAAALGSLSASEVISHFGARPQKSLAAMARAAGLL